MSLTTAQQVRLRIQDAPRWFDDTYRGDGTASVFDIPQINLTSASAYVVAGNTAWSATGATLNPSGVVSFSGVITANSAWRVRGVHSTFSDEEIGQFTAVGGTIAGAALEAARTLAFDGLKRARWAAPDGSTYDDTAVLQSLYQLIANLESELEDESLGAGEFVSWAEGQGDYW